MNVVAALLLTTWTHVVDVTIDPNNRHLTAVDRVTVGEAPADRLRFDLHAGLRIRSFLVDGKESLPSLHKTTPAGTSHLSAYEHPATRAGAVIVLKYDGTIHDPVKQEGELGFVTGDATTGLIGPEGVFLDGGTGWVPIVRSAGGELARYAVTAKVPPAWKSVTQSADVPSDGAALVAGRYQVKSIDHGGVRISTYFFPEEAGLADLYLKSTAEYLDRFSALLTPYPYKRFDIVENFFTTGYGFPAFTLLGQDVVKMGEMALRPGYVDHEVMHCWWGNYVYPDTATGNWSEGLTTYFANYMAQEAIGAEAAAEYRRNIASKYSLRVKPSFDYPLSRFVVKTHDYDNEIGYGKAAMVFHMLRRMSGDEKFFTVMRGMVERFGGRRAGWDDFRQAFEQATGRDLRGFFERWIGTPGLPGLELEGIAVTRTQRGYKVTGSVIQQTGQDTVPVVIDAASGRREFDVVTGQPFSLEVDALPTEVRLDPDMHVPRHLGPREIPPCLNAVIESEHRRVIVPGAVKGNAEDPYMQIAQRISGAKGGEILGDGEATDAATGFSLLLLGRPDENSVTKSIIGRLDPPVKMLADGFTVAGESFHGADYSLLVSTRSPSDPDQVVTLYFGMSPGALSRARYALFYGWDSWVVFKEGRVEKRGLFETNDPRSRQLLLTDSPGVASIDGEALMAHVRTLASPAMAGRRAGGGAGHDAAAAYIESQLGAAGLPPAGRMAPFAEGYRHSFRLDLPDVESGTSTSAQVMLRRPSGTLTFDAEPFPFLPPQGSPEEVSFTDQVVFIDPDELAWLGQATDTSSRLDGGIVVTMERLGEPPEASALADRVSGAARLGAAALLIMRGGQGPSAHESLISFPSRLSPQDRQTIETRRKKGGFPGVDIFLAGQRSRLPFAGPHPELMVLSVGPQLGVELFGRERFARLERPPMKAVEPGVRPVFLQVDAAVSAKLRRDPRVMVNLLGYLEGSDPALAGEMVLVSAHYDAMGQTEDSTPLPGAADNAAGVASLIEMARLFAAGPRPRRSILFAFFDAEEWGLSGSRALVGRMGELGAKVTAALNVDSLGGGDPGLIFLIGGSRQPALRRVAAAAASIGGMKLGRDIDAYAFDYGSDYYPFHLAGLPAAGYFAADYRSLHTSADRIEAVNREAVLGATRTAALTVWAMAN